VDRQVVPLQGYFERDSAILGGREAAVEKAVDRTVLAYGIAAELADQVVVGSGKGDAVQCRLVVCVKTGGVLEPLPITEGGIVFVDTGVARADNFVLQ
jgi:hypothetical protein